MRSTECPSSFDVVSLLLDLLNVLDLSIFSMTFALTYRQRCSSTYDTK